MAADRHDHNAHAGHAHGVSEQTLHDQFGLEHTTLQVDHVHEELLQVEKAPAASNPA